MSPVLSAGAAQYVDATQPDASFTGLSYLKVQKDTTAALVFLPTTGLMFGFTPTLATLRLTTKGNAGVTATVVAQAADGPWGGLSTTWNNSPAGTGPTATVTQATSADGDVFALDVLPLLLAGASNGVKLTRTDTDGPLEWYSFDSANPPTLEIAYTTTPAAPTNLSPNGGRVVGTYKPTVRFDAGDVTYVRVQIDAAGDFGSPDFDSDWVPATAGELDLSRTDLPGGIYGGLSGSGLGSPPSWRAQYKNSSGAESPWSDVATMTYHAYPAITWISPSPDGAWIVTDPIPTIEYDLGSATQVTRRITVARASQPFAGGFDTGWAATPSLTTQIPDGVIRDSSPMLLTLEVVDDFDREAVPGYPVAATYTATFTFQPTGAVPPPDTFYVEQNGVSPFNTLVFGRSAGKPDSWHIRRDELLIFGAADTADLQPGDDGLYRIVDYTAGGGIPHHYKVDAKVGGQVSSGGPTFDILTFPKGDWLGVPDTGEQIGMWKVDDSDTFTDMDMPEVAAVYAPLRGTESVRVTQSQRGYEGSFSENVYLYDDADTGQTARQAYQTLMRIRNNPNPDKPYVIATPYLAFTAWLGNVKATPYFDETGVEAWKVGFDYGQVGDLLWLGRQPQPPELVLVTQLDFEEGTDGAPITTTTNPLLDATSGAPKYEHDEALHGSNMGMLIPAASGGGWISTPAPYIGTVDMYWTPRSSSDIGSVFRMDAKLGAGTSFYLQAKSGGDFAIADETGHNVESSHGVYGWEPNHTVRLLTQYTYSPGQMHVRTYLFESPESEFWADVWEATFPTTHIPGELIIGNGNATKSSGYDDVRLFAGNAVLPDPLQPGEAAAVWSIPGALTASGATVQSKVSNTDTIQLAVSTSIDGAGDPVSPTYYDPDGSDGEGQPVSPEGLVSHTFDGGDPDTTYYAKLSPAPDVFIGDLIEWTTLPAPQTSFSRKIAFVSCQRNAATSQTQLVWQDILAWGADDIWHVGDFDYSGAQATNQWQSHLDLYTTQILGLAAMKQAIARAGFILQDDDHAFSADNGQSLNNPVRAANIQAIQRIFPNYTYGDPRPMDQKRSLYGSFMLGSHIRVLMVDGESLDRSDGHDTDGPAKTFLGAEQDAWLRSMLVQPAALNLIVTQKAFLGDVNHTEATSDKPQTYGVWRAKLASDLAAMETADGKPVHVYFWGGDRHSNDYESRTDNPLFADTPMLVSSGVEQHALDLFPGEDYTAAYGAGDHTLNIPVVQYVQVTISDAVDISGDGSGTVTISVQSREVHDTYDSGTHQQTDPDGWVLVDGFAESDSWDYTAMPGELRAPWVGDITQDLVQISAVTGSAWNVGLQVSANPDMSSAVTYPSVVPDDQGWTKWADVPTPVAAGGTFYYRFTDTLPAGGGTAPIGDIYSAQVPYPAGASCVVKVAAGSCRHTPPNNPVAFLDALAWGAYRFVNLGDNNYPSYLDTTQASHKTNLARAAVADGQLDVQKRMAMPYITSDHDKNGSRRYWPGGNGANYHDPVTQANTDAQVAVVPITTADVRSPIRGLYRSNVEGLVRHVYLDTRTWDRTDVRQNGVLPTDPTSTMLGATQLAWLLGEIDAAKAAHELVVLYTDPQWVGVIGDDVIDSAGPGTGIPISYSDKWPAYQVERDAISDYADAAGVPLFIIDGDGHAHLQDRGTHEKNGFTAVTASPTDQQRHAHFTESNDWWWPTDLDHGGKEATIQQYTRFTFISDVTLGTVTVQVEARDCWSQAAPFSPTANVGGKDYGTFTEVYNLGGGTGALEALDPGDQTSNDGDTVSLQLHAVGGVQPYSWGCTGLPTGLSCSSDGLISGSTSAVGSFTVTATVTDDDSTTSQVVFDWLVQSAPPPGVVVTDPGDQTSTVGDAVSLKMSATGGVPPYTWAGSTLPTGSTMRRGTGRINGTVTTPGTYHPHVVATDSTGVTGSVDFDWVVNDGQGDYVPPAGSISPDIVDGDTFRKKAVGANTHANFTSYQA